MKKNSPDLGFSASIVVYRKVLINGQQCYRVTRYYSVCGLHRTVRQIGLISFDFTTGWHYNEIKSDCFETRLSVLAASQVANKLAKLNKGVLEK